MKKLVRNLICIGLFALALDVHADKVEVKGIGVYQYEGTFFQASKPTDTERAKAMSSAKLSAWKNFVAKLNGSQQQIIAQNEEAALQNIDKFMLDFVVLDSSKDPNLKTLNLVARVAFNDEAVSQFLQKLSVGAGGSNGTRSTNSVFSFLFMARKQTSIKQFDQRRTDIQKTTSAMTTAADGERMREQMNQSGGNTLRKEDELAYSVTSSQDLDSAMGEVLTSAGIEYIGYEDIVGNCNGLPPKAFQSEYVMADEMSPKTRAAVINAVRACEVRYFATGTVDTGLTSRDPVSGNQQVFVSVRSQLWDISQKIPRRVGSVGPKQYSGLGPDQGIAARNALSLAARDLAKTLVDQLNAKGIR